jgi:hypothetical protein
VLYATTFLAGLLFLLVYDMTVKPEIDDAAFVGGLLGAAIAAALVYWRYTVALGQPAPAPLPVHQPNRASPSVRNSRIRSRGFWTSKNP